MSRIQETKRAYDKLGDLLDQEIRKRSGPTQELERVRQTLDAAFHLLGWAKFEYLVRKAAEERNEDSARAHTMDVHAWRYLKQNMKNIPVRPRLDLILHGNPVVRSSLDKEYTVRNEVAHDYKLLPKEAKDLSIWLNEHEDLVEKFG